MTATSELLGTWNSCGYYRLVGMRVVRADHDLSALRIEITPEHLQAYGTAHGGVVAGLLDAAMGLAILARVPSDRGCATVEMKLNFTAPAPPGMTLTAVGWVLHEGKRLVVASAEAHDESGATVACAQGTFSIFPLSQAA